MATFGLCRQPAFEGSPESELEVAYLLGVAQEYLPFPFVVTAINDSFPDCEGLDPTTGRRITIELEVRSRNFMDHGHPPNGCDYIVCWEDNWLGHEPPPTIVALKPLFEATPALQSRIVYRPRPGSVRGQLAALKNSHPEAYDTLTYFLDVLFPRLQLRLPDLALDDSRTKQFVIRYRSGRRLLCIFPGGKLEGAGVADMVTKYGQSVADETRVFSQVIRSIGVMRTRDDAARILDALESLSRVIEAGATPA